MTIYYFYKNNAFIGLLLYQGGYLLLNNICECWSYIYINVICTLSI